MEERVVFAATVILDELFLLPLDFFGLGVDAGRGFVGGFAAAAVLNEDVERFLVDPLLTQSVR